MQRFTPEEIRRILEAPETAPPAERAAALGVPRTSFTQRLLLSGYRLQKRWTVEPVDAVPAASERPS
jgi:hypothetical protein